MYVNDKSKITYDSEWARVAREFVRDIKLNQLV
jgi:hypothetical protein